MASHKNVTVSIAGIRWPEAIALLQAMETKTTCASNVVTWSWTWRPVGWYDFSSHPTGSHSSYPVFSAGNSHLRSPTMLPSTLAPKHWNGNMPFTFLTECRGRMIGRAETYSLCEKCFEKTWDAGNPKWIQFLLLTVSEWRQHSWLYSFSNGLNKMAKQSRAQLRSQHGKKWDDAKKRYN